MSTTRRNKIIEVVVGMPVGSRLPVRDLTAIPTLHEANNSKYLKGCLKITNTYIEKLRASQLEKDLKGLV
jgi:hypothetical protein